MPCRCAGCIRRRTFVIDTSPATPAVSLVVPVFNALPHLTACLDSILGQTIGADAFEIVAVDDGSTDGSADVLDAYAAEHPQLRVLHQPNSGGPGGPRNVGLDHAVGTYVFFIDADDYLGPEALQRLVAMADRNGSDIVLARMVGLDGRPVPQRPFKRNRDRVPVEDVYSTLSVFKLFRRSLIERLGLRFEVGLAGHEDGPFTAKAYLEASVISVLADYDAYYYRPGNRRGARVDLVPYLEGIGERMELVARYRPPGVGRDRLMIRHVWDIARAFSLRWQDLDTDARTASFDTATRLMQQWHTQGMQNALPQWPAIRAYCVWQGLQAELEDVLATPARVAYGDPIVEGGRVFARYPPFRGPGGIPDRCFEIGPEIRPNLRTDVATLDGTTLTLTGEGYITFVGGRTTIVLRRRPRGAAYEFPTEVLPTPELRDRHAGYRRAGFTVAIDLATAADGRPLPAGMWAVVAVIGSDDVRRTIAVSRPGASSTNSAGQDIVLGTTSKGALRLRVGPAGRSFGPDQLGRVRRGARRTLRRLWRKRPWR
jgi:glycosyltransferase involved in cell wall biosynthesis